MLKLTNIEQKGDVISATVTTTEIEPQFFEVAVNVTTGEIVKNTMGEMNEYSRVAVSRLFKTAKDMGKLNLPKNTEPIWY